VRQQSRERSDYVKETTLRSPRSVKKEEEVLQKPEQRFFLFSQW